MSSNDSLTNSSSLFMGTVAMEQYEGYDTNVDMSSMQNQDAGRVISRVILPIICACGILGIILTVIVLSRKSMCTSTNCLLMALAVTDLLFLLILATTLADNQFTRHSKSYYHYVIYVTYSTIFMHIFLLASIWMTVMLAVERYIAICRPFLAAKFLTINIARMVIVVIFIFALVCRLPNFWENRVVTVYDTTTNSSLVYMEVTDLSVNEHYILLYPWIIDGIMTSMIPFVSLLILNLRLILEVRKSTKYIQRNLNVARGSGVNTVQKEEVQITIMLISVIMVFFICQAPYVIYTAIVSITKYAAPSSGFWLFRHITMLLLTLKSAINFILYCWFSEKFWMTLKRIFCWEQCVRFAKFNADTENAEYLRMKRYSSCATKDTTI